MANFWRGLFGSRQENRQIAQQLATMQSTTEQLVEYNNRLQGLLSISFRQQGGFTRFDTNNQISFIRQGYNINADVYAIVSDIAQKGASIPLVCYEVIDEGALKTYRSAMSQKKLSAETLMIAKRFKTKALRPVEYDNPVQKLIDNPNAEDNPTTFYETSIGFVLLCGNNYWHGPVLDMGPDKGRVVSMNIMPSQFVGLIVRQGFPAVVLGYELIIDGLRLMESKDVIHMRTPNYDWGIDGQQLYGMPPLKAGWNTLNLSNSGETSMTSMFANGGPKVIISNKSISPDDYGIEQMGKIAKMNNDEYSGNTNRGKVKWMIGDISSIPTGLSPVDLNIIEGMSYSFDRLCNIFGVSSIMYNNHSASTESNVKEMIRDSWTRGVLPLRKMHCDSFNRGIVPAYNEKGLRYFVDMDLSGIADLQPDKATQATWLSTSWWITPNQKLKIQDMEESDDPNMNKVYAPSGLTALEDVSIDVEALPNMPEDDNLNA